MLFRKNLLIFSLFLSTHEVHAAPSVHGATQSFVESINWNDEDDPKARAAVFMLYLWQQGSVGKKTGLCIDFDVNPKTGAGAFKIGLSTSAFKTGSSVFKENKSEKEEVGHLQKLIQDIYEYQIQSDPKAKVNMTVTGYADAQHIHKKNPFTVEQSISDNKRLSSARADTVAKLFKDNQNIVLGKSEGIASEELEREHRGVMDGIECEMRRKVVVRVEAPLPETDASLSGILNRTPDTMDTETRSKLKSNFALAANQITARFYQDGKFDDGTIEDWGKKVVEELQRQKRISTHCQASPLKEVMEAVVESNIESWLSVNERRNLLQRASSRANAFVHRIGIGKGKQTKADRVQAALIKAGYTVNDRFAAGDPAIYLSCLQDAGLYQQLKEKNAQNNFEVSGANYLKNQSAKRGKVTIGFDPAAMVMDQENLERAHQKMIGPHNEVRSGIFCKKCGFGIYWNKVGNKWHSSLYDRVIAPDLAHHKDQDLVTALNELSKNDPLAVGSYQKPRIFVIKNCKDCQCNSEERIRKQENVVTIDPLSQGDQEKYTVDLDVNEFRNSCVIRPPVMHTCGIDPSSGNEADVNPVFAKKLDVKIFGKVIAKQVDQLFDAVPASGDDCPTCGATPGQPKLTWKDAIGDVLCSDPDHPEKRLPSGDEKADCPPHPKVHKRTSTKKP